MSLNVDLKPLLINELYLLVGSAWNSVLIVAELSYALLNFDRHYYTLPSMK